MNSLSKENMENASGGVRKLISRMVFDASGEGKPTVNHFLVVYNDETGEVVQEQPLFYEGQPKNEEERQLLEWQLNSLQLVDNAVNSKR